MDTNHFKVYSTMNPPGIPNELLPELGSMDIYLIDQILKGRIQKNTTILDAGFGKGRNLLFFASKGMDVYGVDHNCDNQALVKEVCLEYDKKFDTSKIIHGKTEALPFKNHKFDLVLSIAVLHFSNSDKHFIQQLNELERVLKPKGYLFIRMHSWHTMYPQKNTASNILENDQGIRYLFDLELFESWKKKKALDFEDPIKPVSVEIRRTMNTIVLKKK